MNNIQPVTFSRIIFVLAIFLYGVVLILIKNRPTLPEQREVLRYPLSDFAE